jgi:hypothetical protein
MQVKAITFTKDAKKVELDGCCRFWMPLVFCERCKRRSGEPAANFPALSVPQHLEKCLEANEKRKPITVDEYRIIRDQVLSANGRNDLILPPLSGVGVFEAKLLVGRLYDFAWINSWTPLISKEALRRLADKNINLKIGGLQLTCGAGNIGTHVALQCELAALLAEETIEGLALEKCDLCQEYHRKSMRVNMMNYEATKYFKRANFKGDVHLVRLHEWSTFIIASEQFVEAVQDLGLTGIQFDDVGEWV